MAEQDEQLNEMDPHDRRRFFRAGLSRLLRPVAGFIEKKLPILPYAGERMLRPPGAIEERDFLETCFRCGSCVDACPANSIVAIASSDERLNGTPQVDPAVQACVICDELACMKACPSGALKLVDRFEIRMGLAVVDYEVCVRTAGEDCRICVERCPLGETAIGIDDEGRVVVVDPGATGRGCTGCGVCEQYCPTRPMRAIRIDAV
ncbi:MAG: 4Fe-4S dicluster domain-containing protein [Planctomycetia bacterium]|nr:4Fe-4S dicluster domain-containing protein [Planctomycetia bacterium]MCC7316169.1 4Fe-4S dicluster domain-containing protein [Planctomycetota bacterium]OQZ06503.1 MAG: hypothetical protein B6D36_04650 [Planctomycetes bacterium UTPLA1]